MNVTQLKNIIKNKIPEKYRFKTNFSSADFFIEIGNYIIIAKPICIDNQIKYEFMVDVEFISQKEINYEELNILKEVIDILEDNKKTAISRLRKWTVDEFEQYKKIREKKSQELLEVLKSIF